jgi:hypothetical protein
LPRRLAMITFIDQWRDHQGLTLIARGLCSGRIRWR